MERLGCSDELMSERYDRHIRLSEIGEQGQRKLSQASVLLVGVGGLGSPIALYLAAAGVGRIGLVDGDEVSLSNLQRQVLYKESEVGKSKVMCAAARLGESNAHAVVDCYPFRLDEANAHELISRYDVIIDGCDNYETRYLIDKVCYELRKPYVYGSIGEFRGQVSVFHYGGAAGYVDLFPDKPDTASVTSGVMGVVPGVVGTLQASEVIKIITGCGRVLSNRLLIVDLLGMDIRILDL